MHSILISNLCINCLSQILLLFLNNLYSSGKFFFYTFMSEFLIFTSKSPVHSQHEVMYGYRVASFHSVLNKCASQGHLILTMVLNDLHPPPTHTHP